MTMSQTPPPSPARRPASPSRPAAVHYPYLFDFSGFHNAGNDCYGCSALTMLLRSTVVRRALLNSPLVVATRRYEALINRRSERRVQWTSGYVVDPVAPAFASRAATRARKRSRAADEEETVGDVCGLLGPPTGATPSRDKDSAAGPAPPRPFQLTPTRAVRETLDLVETFTVDELEDALNVDYDTERLPVTLHSALAFLVRSERWRERLTASVNAASTSPSERQQLMEEKVWSEGDRSFDGQVYTYGIRLNVVASLFRGDFFTGEQEDAHELFVALMAKLETEAVDFQKRCAAVVAAREGEGLPAVHAEHEPTTSTLREGSTSSLLITGTLPPPPSSLSSRISTAMADAWINTLVQTRLLNVIRCRSPGCHHEIVTDEICVNLSLHIPEKKEKEAKAKEVVVEEEEAADAEGAEMFGSSTPPVRPPSVGPEQERGAHPSTASQERASSHTPSTASSASSRSTPGEGHATSTRCSVSALLKDSMAFEPLSDYKCDSCGSKAAQYQGGCFYTRPPPVLVLQLKRFSTEFVRGSVHIRKNDRCVAVEDTLVVYALPSTEELRQHEGQPLRTVTLEEAQGRARETATVKESGTTDVVAGAQERCFYYDAEHKCFTCTSGMTPPAGTAKGGKEEEEEGQRVDADEGHEGQCEVPPTGGDATVWVAAIRSIYRLQSCVLHLGHSLHYGHYVSDFAVEGEEASPSNPDVGENSEGKSNDDEDDDGEEYERVRLPNAERAASTSVVPDSHGLPLRRLRWRRANDARVTVLSPAMVESRRAGRSDMYLLLYEKVGEEWVRCPVDAVLPKPVYPTEKK